MKTITRLSVDAVLGAVALASAAGCYHQDVDGLTAYDEQHMYDAHPANFHEPDYDYYPGRYRDRYPGHYRDRESREHHRVPRDAQRVAEGSGNLMYTPDRDGRVYVRDERTGKVIARDRVEAGQKVNVDPERRRIEVDGRTTRDELSRKPREREVYFRPDRDRGGSKGRDENAGGGERRREKANDDGPREREHRDDPDRKKGKD